MIRAVADTLALMNLLAAPDFARAADRRDLRIQLLPETAKEIQEGDCRPALVYLREVLEVSLEQGRIRISDCPASENPDLYCQLVPALMPVTAKALMLAQSNDAVFITESPKLLRYLNQLIPGSQSTTGLSIVKQWIAEDHWKSDEIKTYIQTIALHYRPTQAHPLYDWWLEQI